MKNSSSVEYDDKGWDVPDFENVTYREKQNKYALVIPVINEGERIREQLLRITEAKLPVDVIVSDGGSTDGSLEPSFIKKTCVSAVLTKTGSGKLSAQLRMAYAWCIRKGYGGVVTIDGNGKDGVEAVADMVQKLEEGYDYVQGSRYLKGGLAKNTPHERTFANRFIHAPLLSLAGKHWFTDTTNGFRAYSARYLTHPEVQPFRDVFQNYELLFYLTARAGQIGMKVGHVPVKRIYPDVDKIPTKITGFLSKLMVLGQTINVATGGYTPNENVKHAYSPIPGIITFLIILVLFILNLAAPPYGPDGWAYYELSQTIFTDFFHITHLRTYWTDVARSSSFPLLFPILIGVLDAVFSTGERTAVIISFLSFFIFAFLSERIIRRNFNLPFIGYGLALTLAVSCLHQDLITGMTIPLQLCFYLVLFSLLLRYKTLQLTEAILVGVVTGLAMLNRFDGVMLVALIPAMIFFLTRKIVPSLVAAAIAVAVFSPWILYSQTYFGVPLVSDNSVVAKAVSYSAHVTDWWPTPQPTLWDDFEGWFAKVLDNATFLTFYLIINFLIVPVFLFHCIFLLFTLSIIDFFALSSLRKQKPKSRHYEKISVIGLFALAMLILSLPQILTGYFTIRYWPGFYWFTLLLAVTLILGKLNSWQQAHLFSFIYFILISVLFIPSISQQYPNLAAAAYSYPKEWKSFDDPQIIEDLSQCLGGNKRDRILVLDDLVDQSLTARIGGQGGFPVLLEPKNFRFERIDTAEYPKFVKAWNVRYILVVKPEREEFALKTFSLQKVEDCNLILYKVTN
nr:hypothetical protein [Cytophagales bacterium]